LSNPGKKGSFGKLGKTKKKEISDRNRQKQCEEKKVCGLRKQNLGNSKKKKKKKASKRRKMGEEVKGRLIRAKTSQTAVARGGEKISDQRVVPNSVKDV